MKKIQYAAVTLIGRDEPGIIAAVSRVMYVMNCNLEDASMTRLDGQFVMVFIVKMDSQKTADSAKQALHDKAHQLKLDMHWSPITYTTHESSRKKNEAQRDNKGSYLITVIGPDRTGIVYHISKIIAQQEINITDMNCEVIKGSRNKPLYAMMIEVELGHGPKITRLSNGLKRAAEKLKVDCRLKCVEAVTM
ncbi:MAG: hypothetical protein A2Z83_02690 [Omnitrophica bacterium GWA2_52_8]|nr:MAG: hypothetical protein A2Z83_02690 [Omnitrophica bacterium GWA2_52_8]